MSQLIASNTAADGQDASSVEKTGTGPVTVRTSRMAEGTLAVRLVDEAALAVALPVVGDGDEEPAVEAEAEEMVGRQVMARLTTDCYKCGQSGHWANACPNA